MSLYNDGYSNRAFVLAAAGAGGALSFGSVVFTQTAENNLLANDTFEIGNSTFTVVGELTGTPGQVLKGASWAATMSNIAAALAASVAGTPATANYVPLAVPANVGGSVAGNTATFSALVPGTTFPAVYSDVGGTAGGAFSAAQFGSALAAPMTRAVDWTIGLGLSIQFEIVAPIVNPAVFSVWSDVPAIGNPCAPSGIAANQVQMADTDLCHPITGAMAPMVITIPPTAITTYLNNQGFLETDYVSAVGGFVQGRPRCLAPGTLPGHHGNTVSNSGHQSRDNDDA